MGDEIILRPKPVGTLVHDALLPGKRLWFFATGTGFAPFASLLREPQTYEDYDEVIITHTCREVGELTYGAKLIEDLKDDELLNDVIGRRVLEKDQILSHHDPRTEPQNGSHHRPDEIRRGVHAIWAFRHCSPETDRAMICGNLAFNLELKAMFEDYGLEEGANSKPAHYVVEKAFLD